MNIAKYNQNLLDTGMTHTQHYTHKYADMQKDITHIIDTINQFIWEKNHNNNVSTPFCHSAIRTRKGTKRRHYYTDNWEGLSDGVHATKETRVKWAQSISQAIKYNRGLLKRKTPDTHTPQSDEDKSPKRSWRRERGDLV